MLIKKIEHNGHDAQIKFCHPDKSWGRDTVGKFRVESAFGVCGYYETYGEAHAAFIKAVDDFMADVPSSDEEWVKAIEDCMVWTGYEDCHIDECRAIAVLSKASKYFKGPKK